MINFSKITNWSPIFFHIRYDAIVTFLFTRFEDHPTTRHSEIITFVSLEITTPSYPTSIEHPSPVPPLKWPHHVKGSENDKCALGVLCNILGWFFFILLIWTVVFISVPRVRIKKSFSCWHCAHDEFYELDISPPEKCKHNKINCVYTINRSLRYDDTLKG